MKISLGGKLRLASALLVSSLIAGCNGFTPPVTSPADYKGRSSVFAALPFPGAFHGSAAQWNEDYAVTVNHIPYLRNVVHVCTTGCDMSFIKRKAKGPLPEWRSAVPGEKLTPVGTPFFYYPVHSTGYAKSTMHKLSTHPEGERSASHDAPIQGGMSGGPIYAEDGKIVGITEGLIHTNRLSQSISKLEHYDKDDPHSSFYGDRISYYMPYERIKKEWEIFQEREKAGLPRVLPNNVLYR